MVRYEKLTQNNNTTKRQYIRAAKHVTRVAAGAALLIGEFMISGALFIVAEVLNIIEERV